MLQLVGVRLSISRTPTAVTHRDIPLLHEPAEGHRVIGRERRRGTHAVRFPQNDLFQHLLRLPFGSFRLQTDSDIAPFAHLLSVGVLSVHEVLSVPRLHPLTVQVNAAFLILHSHKQFSISGTALSRENSSIVSFSQRPLKGFLVASSATSSCTSDQRKRSSGPSLTARIRGLRRVA